ncbi:hypothetical protein CYFUS_003606 [Cystobacter fuscus]|uniref:Pentapeptide repeat protein n=2 Tax=Cystobacter fuscus TaxID=43 RepID=A0A250J3M0_9BACT|nr:pentapeptide repeat-containing protein [Cystobacter fuscus]ATB38173.1 hypothetical protein CYFUS_003606 [Cystobacter fuscus]
MLATKAVLKNREIKNERLELTDKGSLYFLGPELTLSHCTVVLKVSARSLLIREGTRFIDCTFEVKKELKNHQDWVFASLKGCRFKGRLSGCEFGRWPDYSEGWEHGSIDACDFSEAHLDGCRFHGCDMSTLQLPLWPCFTILDPLRRGPELVARQWPGDVGIAMKGHLREPPSTVAVTWSASVLAKEGGTTPEAIKAVLDQCEGIVY